MSDQPEIKLNPIAELANKRNGLFNLFIMLLVVLAVILLIETPDNDDSTQASIITGKDISLHVSQFEPYVSGVIDAALITDSSGTFTCDLPLTLNNNDIKYNVIKEIGQDETLQRQPAQFAILNAYKKAYCK